MVARWAHNPKVVGSNPASATKIVSHEADARASPESRGGSSYSYSTYYISCPFSTYAPIKALPSSRGCRQGASLGLLVAVRYDTDQCRGADVAHRHQYDANSPRLRL